MCTFDKLTIIVTASNEKSSLGETLRKLAELCDPKDIAEVIVFLKSENCSAKSDYEKTLQDLCFPFPIRSYVQTIPGYAEMFYEAPTLVHSSHFLCIGADLEMDPDSIPALIETSKANPEAIVCASKFAKGSTREGYGFFHMIAVRFVNFIVRKIIGSNGTELFSTVEIHPTKTHFEMNFSSDPRSFYGFTIKQVICGVPYIEIPTKYVKNNKEKTNFGTFDYLKLTLPLIDTAIRLKIEKIKNDRKNKQEKKKKKSTL